LIPLRHFYGVQFLNMTVKSFVIIHQLFQSAEETCLTIINPDKMSYWYQINSKVFLNKNQGTNARKVILEVYAFFVLQCTVFGRKKWIPFQAVTSVLC